MSALPPFCLGPDTLAYFQCGGTRVLLVLEHQLLTLSWVCLMRCNAINVLPFPRYIYDRRRKLLATPKDASAFREELDIGDRSLLADKTRWIVIVHFGNHFELVYRCDQLGYVPVLEYCTMDGPGIVPTTVPVPVPARACVRACVRAYGAVVVHSSLQTGLATFSV